MAVTLVVSMGLLFTLPARFSLGPSWLVPALEAVLLAALIIADPGRLDRQSAEGRILSLTLVSVLVLEATGVSVRLVVDLIEGGPETNSAAALLHVGFTIWISTIVAFAFFMATGREDPEAALVGSTRVSRLRISRAPEPWCSPSGLAPGVLRLLVLGLYQRHRF